VHQERRSQSIFSLGQRDLGSAGLGETPGTPIDPVASIASGDDYRDIGARFDLAQQVGSIFLAKLQSRMTRSGSLAAKCWTIFCRPDAAATRILYCSRSSPTMRLMIGLSSTMKMRAA
jgi:hypothetical protein